jgi:membrane protease YdiL (CAAX protease family)
MIKNRYYFSYFIIGMYYTIHLLIFYIGNRIGWLIPITNIQQQNIIKRLIIDLLPFLFGILLIYIYMRKNKYTIHDLGINRKYKGLYIAMIFLTILLTFIQKHTIISRIYALFFYLCIIAVLEEIFFRGILYKTIVERYGYHKAIYISGIIYGIAHLIPQIVIGKDTSITSVFNYTIGLSGVLMSYIFVWIYKKTDNLLIAIVVHGFVDYCGFLSL